MQEFQPFVYQSHAARIIFGAGTLARIAREVNQIGKTRALVLSTPNQESEAQRVADLLGSLSAGIHAGAVMHVPVSVVEEALERVRTTNADCIVAIGGGSTTGLAKAIALQTDLPYIAIPTSYAGSEMTPIYGLTDAGQKRTGRDLKVLPRAVIYDPELTVGLPAQLSVTSGLNAIAHAAEGLYAADANPVMSLMAEEGIRSLASGIPKVVANPADLDARSQCLQGAWLCGTVLGSIGMALHHKLCHTLGGSFNLPHAETHTVVLPHALAYNASAAPQAMVRIRRALESGHSAAAAVYDLAASNGAPVSLRDIGMLESDLDKAADLAVANPYPNPRPLERAPIRALLQAAFEGTRPA